MEHGPWETPCDLGLDLFACFSVKQTLLSLGTAPRPTVFPLFDFPGVCDLRGCSCDFHPGGVGTTGPSSEDLVPGGDAGELWAPGLTG